MTGGRDPDVAGGKFAQRSRTARDPITVVPTFAGKVEHSPRWVFDLPIRVERRMRGSVGARLCHTPDGDIVGCREPVVCRCCDAITAVRDIAFRRRAVVVVGREAGAIRARQDKGIRVKRRDRIGRAPCIIGTGSGAGCGNTVDVNEVAR